MQNLMCFLATDLTVVVFRNSGAQVSKYLLDISTYVILERQGNIFFSK